MEEIHCHFTICFFDHILPGSNELVELAVPRILCQSKLKINWRDSQILPFPFSQHARNVDLRGVGVGGL
jgi:hypothetical protein